MGLSIAFATAEVTPFAKTGGLGDVTAALAKELQKRGHDVRVFLPFYSSIDLAGSPIHEVEWIREVSLRMGSWDLSFSLYTARLPGSDLWIYLVHCPALYHRDGVYSGDWDEYLRYAFFSRAVLESCQRMGWTPDVLHCHDWHTALVPLYLRTLYAWDEKRFGRTRTVLTIHNLGYQGVVSSDRLPDLGLEAFSSLFSQDDLAAGRVSFMKTGLLYADRITTVSRTYAEEIQRPEHGLGLDPILRARRDALLGIVNGVDYEEWSPEKDRYLPEDARYSREDPSNKRAARAHLLAEVKLPPAHESVPVIGLVSRLTGQKGLELLFDVMPPLLGRQDLRFVALGTGEPAYQDFLLWLQHAFRGRVCYYRGYSDELAHLVEAGADMFVMPSRYEPCGLNQMYSLRYGTPPIVRRTGGLADTVRHFDPATGEGTGFVFEHYTPIGLHWAIEQAFGVFRRPELWRRLVSNAMAEDWAWSTQVLEYEQLYRDLVGSAR